MNSVAHPMFKSPPGKFWRPFFIYSQAYSRWRLNINQKLDVKNTAGLVKEALKRGLIE